MTKRLRKGNHVNPAPSANTNDAAATATTTAPSASTNDAAATATANARDAATELLKKLDSADEVDAAEEMFDEEFVQLASDIFGRVGLPPFLAVVRQMFAKGRVTRSGELF
ncbi:hypothetical protein HDU86_007502 [Geranomyces michiganensis]|nr:hypothetical protein HDU86_007502 [Geranomyces michiganensis]